jgi:hypothetical protein
MLSSSICINVSRNVSQLLPRRSFADGFLLKHKLGQCLPFGSLLSRASRVRSVTGCSGGHQPAIQAPLPTLFSASFAGTGRWRRSGPRDRSCRNSPSGAMGIRGNVVEIAWLRAQGGAEVNPNAVLNDALAARRLRGPSQLRTVSQGCFCLAFPALFLLWGGKRLRSEPPPRAH